MRALGCIALMQPRDLAITFCFAFFRLYEDDQKASDEAVGLRGMSRNARRSPADDARAPDAESKVSVGH